MVRQLEALQLDMNAQFRALAESRQIKPEIPLTGYDGIPNPG